MTTLLVEREAETRLVSQGGGGATLDDLLSGAWDELATAAATGAVSAACPVCDGELVPRWSAGAGVVGGRCRDCASELS